MGGPALHVRLLGELALRGGDGAPRELPPSRRTRALLGYLVATGRPHSRSALCDLLWDGTDDPRASLRWSLTKLRALVDDGALVRLQADRDSVGFVGRDCRVDAQLLDALLGGLPPAELPLEQLEQAAPALSGEFLDGLELPACYRFHHWWMAERERYARLRRGVLEALTARLADAPARALPHARAMVATDPLAEAAHATLVRLLAAAGRYPEAEQHHAYARELLRREIALPDGGELDQTIRAVRRRQRQAAAHAPAGAEDTREPALAEAAPPERVAERAPAHTRAFAELARAAVPERLPPIGREAECDAIVRALASPTAAPVLLLLGEPGIGKTRLLDHLADLAAARGLRQIGARCFEAEAVRPYGWWVDALRRLPAADGAGAAVAPLVGGLSTTESREQLFEGVVRLLDGLARAAPLVVAVDDLQWIDEASAALLHLVVRRLAEAGRACVLVAAARSAEVDENASARGLLQSLGRVHRVQTLALQPLDEATVRRWLGDRLPDLGRAWRDCGGNPLLLLELARATEGGRAPDGKALDALVAERLRALDRATHDVLGWAAAFGGSVRAERLADATGLGLHELLERVGLLERRGLLRGSDDGGFDFAHGLVRDAVYRSLSMARRRAQHRQIARTLAAASADDPWLHGEVVHHASLAGDAPLAARAALAAGEHWLRLFANHDAAQVAERGLALVDQLDAGADRARLEIGLLRLRVAAAWVPGGRRLPDLRSRIRQAVDSALSMGLHGIASSGWEILAYWSQQMGDAAAAQHATLAAERCARLADAVTRCQQLANSGRCLIDIEADGERGRALLADAAAQAAALELPVMELEWGRGLVARADGDLQGAFASLQRAVALARMAANHWREYECMQALATVAFELGRDDEVLALVHEVADAACRMGEAQVPFADALAALSRERLGRAGADAALQASLDALRQRDAKAHLAYALNEVAARALAGGDAGRAATLAAEALDAALAVRRPTLIARARATLARADPGAARHPQSEEKRP